MFYREFVRHIIKSGFKRPKEFQYYSNIYSENFISELEKLLDNNNPDHVITQSEGNDIRKIYFTDNKVFESEYLIKILRDSGYDNYQLAFIVYGFLDGSVPNIGSGEGWHRDAWFDQYKEILFLSDVNELNGPYEYVPGSSSYYSKLVHVLTNKSTRISNVPNHKKSIKVIAKRGDKVSFDATIIHRGSPIFQGSRKALTFYFYPKFSNIEKIKNKFKNN